MIEHCKRCLYPSNHALNLILDDEGICSGCRVHEEKDNIDFGARENRLKELLGKYKNKSEDNYDCIIPVNGGKDSFYIVHLIKNIYGMNPLCVHYNTQFTTPQGQRNLSKLRMEFGVDLIQKTVSPERVKKITRATFRRFGSIYWHVIAGETVYPVQMAVQLKIPLIIWGAHQGMDQAGMFSHHDYVEMTRKYRKDHDCMGFEAESLVNEFDSIDKLDVEAFLYPSNREIEKVGVKGIYLNNYIRWDTRTQHELVIKDYNYESRQQTRTFDCYSNADCYLYSDLHDYLKVIKLGYGKVNDHVAREIRLGHLSKEKGRELIKEYLLKEPKELKMFLDWIGMKESGFWFVANLFRNQLFWKRNEKWEWEYSQKSPLMGQKDDYNFPDILEYKDYLPTKKDHSEDYEDKFILIGRGYIPPKIRDSSF